MNPGTRVDHARFCDNENWTLVRDAKGRKVRHHVTYELVLYDGRVLRTRVSRPVNGDTYGAGLWKAILREQLDVNEAAFWDCVKNRVLPNRGEPSTPTVSTALPAQLVYQLIHVVLVPEQDVAEMTLEQAVARMNEHWTTPEHG